VATVNDRAPGVMLHRLSGNLRSLLARGVARVAADEAIEITLDRDEARAGGMVTIAMPVPVRCPRCQGAAAADCTRCDGTGVSDELYSAWLAVRPGVADGTPLVPSATLAGMLAPVAFRARVAA
jgi:DnaJ-class molecular chaperone